MGLARVQKQILLWEKAYKTLSSVFEGQTELSELEKDGVIQRLEYNVELWWKTLKQILLLEELEFTPSPREVIRQSFKMWFIRKLDLWEEFLDIRNQMSHVYSEYYSDNNFDFISLNHKEIAKTIKILKIKYID